MKGLTRPKPQVSSSSKSEKCRTEALRIWISTEISSLVSTLSFLVGLSGPPLLIGNLRRSQPHWAVQLANKIVHSIAKSEPGALITCGIGGDVRTSGAFLIVAEKQVGTRGSSKTRWAESTPLAYHRLATLLLGESQLAAPVTIDSVGHFWELLESFRFFRVALGPWV